MKILIKKTSRAMFVQCLRLNLSSGPQVHTNKKETVASTSCDHKTALLKPFFLFSYIIDIEEKMTPHPLSLHHFLGAKFTGF